MFQPFSTSAQMRGNALTKLFAALFALSAVAHNTVQAQSKIPLRDVAAPDAVTDGPLGRVVNVVPLKDGTVLINDGQHRQILAVDASLRNTRVRVDSSPVNYGRVPASLAVFPGDSSLLANWSGITVLDPTGRPVRRLPTTALRYIAGIATYTMSIDPDGNYIFRALVNNTQLNALSDSLNGTTTPRASGSQKTQMIVRTNPNASTVRKIATLIAEPQGTTWTEKDADGHMVGRTLLNPLPRSEDFGVLSDGTVAIVREADYHIEYIRPDGSIDSTAALPFAWKALSDADRQGIIDSARTAQQNAQAAGISTTEREIAGVMAGVAVAKGTGISATKPGGGFSVDVKRVDGVAVGTVAANPEGVRAEQPIVAAPFAMRTSSLEYVPYTTLPTRYPPYRNDAVRVDSKDNLWIRTTMPDPAGGSANIYDVVNRRGQLFQRVRIPAEKTIVGFGRDDSIYLSHKVDGNWIVERTHVKN